MANYIEYTQINPPTIEFITVTIAKAYHPKLGIKKKKKERCNRAMNLSRALRISRLSNSSWLGVSSTRAIYLFPSLGHGLLSLDLCKASWECWLWMSSIKSSFQDSTRVAGFVLKKNSLETWKNLHTWRPKLSPIKLIGFWKWLYT